VEGESAEETGGGVLSLAGNGEMSSDLVEKRVKVLDSLSLTKAQPKPQTQSIERERKSERVKESEIV
jgi:hypothetical protein